MNSLKQKANTTKQLIKRFERFTPNFGFVFFFLFFIAKLPNCSTNLSDAFQFRQTQTAWGVREVMENGYNLLQLRLPVLGFPYQVPFEFPLFQNIAGLLGNVLNVSPEEAGRITSLSFYCLSGILTYNLILKFVSRYIAIFCITAFYLTPFSIQWSNALLIESTAAFFLILSATFSRKYFEKAALTPLLISSLSLGICALVKITTAIPSIISIWLVFYLFLMTSMKSIDRFNFFLIHGIFLIPAFLWTRYADSVKEKSKFTNWLTSSELRGWNFGLLDERLSMDSWIKIFARYWLIGGVALIVSCFALILFRPASLRGLKKVSLVLLLIFTPFVFFNLYVIHDYYYVALLFPLIFSVSLILNLSSLGLFKLSSAGLSFATSILFLVPSWAIEIPGVDYKAFIISERSEVPRLSREIMKFTSIEDRIYVVGCDWDPSILYYAHRYGIAAPYWISSTEYALNFIYAAKVKDFPGYLAICGGFGEPSDKWRRELRQVSENIWKFDE